MQRRPITAIYFGNKEEALQAYERKQRYGEDAYLQFIEDGNLSGWVLLYRKK